MHFTHCRRVNGIVDHDYASVRQFLGIPYARPPVGELRWEAPQANRLPRSVNATAFGKSCKQFQGAIPNLFTEDVVEFNVPNVNASGEDCLTLSVWTPERAVNLPVIVFFYGGGWYTGGQDIPYQNPTQWVQRTKDLIVVVLNSRGNIFGFPNAQGVNDQNLGLLDQRLAVEWVRDNIAAFGGSPYKITLWGQSSGAEAVDMYNYAWYKDAIVSGLIMDSGTAFIEAGLGPRYADFSYVASQVGCGNTSSATEELACMKKVDANALEGVIEENYNTGGTPGLAFGPSSDEKVIFANYTERVLEGKLSRIPAIVGVNKEDGNVFAPYNATGGGPDQSISELYFLQIFLCPSFKTVKLRAAANISTYRYLYAGNFSNISPRPWMGAYHQSELPLLFGTHGNYRGSSTKYENAVSVAMQDAWRAFADNPQDGLKGEDWPRYTPTRDIFRSFDRSFVRDGLSTGAYHSDELLEKTQGSREEKVARLNSLQSTYMRGVSGRSPIKYCAT
ncbi:acetylcholinesterase [Pleomassaria siparia CBS 279.74]|uniref:Carboxylic ester hydrolase n=1 Tax=Pleomassaria siparia CBS 279.74 TaxID=1314801 RepID=A0A6G1K0V7_9PLEO|nr:acetylcholinesterase [Pleomassaria siparia CBS 279.74]